MPGQTTTATKRAPRKGKTEAPAPIGRQNQSAAAPADAPKTRTRKAADKGTAPAGSGRGRARQMQPAGAIEKQGESASGKAAAGTEMRGGTMQVLITEDAMAGRSGRPGGPEEYPFGDLSPARKSEDGRTIVGQSFFIPDKKAAEQKLAAARKRHKALFWSRTRREKINGRGPEVEGLRIWRGTPELADLAKR